MSRLSPSGWTSGIWSSTPPAGPVTPNSMPRSAFPVFRHPGGWMVPEPGVRARTVELIREHRIEAVWFGAAAPLALMTPRCGPPG